MLIERREWQPDHRAQPPRVRLTVVPVRAAAERLGGFLTASVMPGDLRAAAKRQPRLSSFWWRSEWRRREGAPLRGATTPARIGAAVAILFVPGLFMGMAFPLGMKLASGRDRLTPWLWGVNGRDLCGRVGPRRRPRAHVFHFRRILGCAACCYVIALIAFARKRRHSTGALMRDRWLGVGLFFLTLSTFAAGNPRRAAALRAHVIAHLSFFAVSLAMLGMAKRRVEVFLHPDRFAPDRARRVWRG